MSKWGKVDYKSLERLQKRMQQLEGADMDAFCRKMAKEIAARLLAKVRAKTPVGTKPKLESKKTEKVTGASGKKRSMLTAEGERYEKYWKGYTGGTLRRNWTCDFNVEYRGKEYRITVYNPTEYAIYVEYGHRQTVGRYIPSLGKKAKKGWVEGRFMMTESVIEMEQQSPKLIEKELEKLLSRMLIDG